MSKIIKMIMVRVIKSRMVEGESLEDIMISYPKLTDEEKQELTDELSKGGV